MNFADRPFTQYAGFAGTCTFVAVLVICLDRVLLATKDRTLLDISYGERSRLVVLGMWAAAAGIVGFQSAAGSIVQPSFQGALAVAVGWPMILEKLLEGTTAVVQVPTEEEDDDSHRGSGAPHRPELSAYSRLEGGSMVLRLLAVARPRSRCHGAPARLGNATTNTAAEETWLGPR